MIKSVKEIKKFFIKCKAWVLALLTKFVMANTSKKYKGPTVKFFVWTLVQGKFWKSLWYYYVLSRNIREFIKNPQDEKFELFDEKKVINLKKILDYSKKYCKCVFGAEINDLFDNFGKCYQGYIIDKDNNDILELYNKRKSLFYKIEEVSKVLLSKKNFPEWAKIEVCKGVLGIVDGFKKEIMKDSSDKTPLNCETYVDLKVWKDRGYMIYEYGRFLKLSKNDVCIKKESREKIIFDFFISISDLIEEGARIYKFEPTISEAYINEIKKKFEMTDETMKTLEHFFNSLLSRSRLSRLSLIEECGKMEKENSFDKIKKMPNADYQAWSEEDSLDDIINDMYITALIINKRI